MKVSFFSNIPDTNKRLSRLLSSPQRESLEITGADYRTAQIDIEGKTVELQLWDVLCSPQTKKINQRFFLGSKAVFLSVDDEQMLDDLDSLVSEIRKTSPYAKIALAIDANNPWTQTHCDEINKKCWRLGIQHIIQFNGSETNPFEPFFKTVFETE